MSETRDVETVETQTGVEIVTPSAMEAIANAEIDKQIATAKRYPRDIARFQHRVTEAIEGDVLLAQKCFYAIPRGGKIIEGKSVRLAELAAANYGNLRVASRIVGIDATAVTAQGVAFDIENNVSWSAEIRERIVDKYGVRLNQDLIGLKANSASSKAARNAVCRVIPQTYLDRFLSVAKRIAAGTGDDIKARRAEALRYCASEHGITAEQVCRVLGVQDVSEIDAERLVTLRGMLTSVIDGEATARTIFGTADTDDPAPPPDPAESRTDALADKLEGTAPKPKTDDEYRGEIDGMLIDLCDGEEQGMIDMLEELTTFTNKDGKKVGTRSEVGKLTKKQLPVIWGRLKKAYDAKQSGGGMPEYDDSEVPF